jgi:hypothetical protein
MGWALQNRCSGRTKKAAHEPPDVRVGVMRVTQGEAPAEGVRASDKTESAAGDLDV